MASATANIVEAVDIPVICDGDTGHGNAINVMRTVREFERAGAAAIFLEDQTSPKRCGQMAGKSMIPMEEMVGKLHAALDARTDPDFVIMGRTDALGLEGMEEAIRRGRAYEQAGVDAIFVVIHRGPQMIDQARTLASSFSKPLMIDIAEAGPRPVIPFDGLESTGVKIAAIPLTLMFSQITAMRRVAREMKQFGLKHLPSLMESNDSWDSVLQLLGQPDIVELSGRYSEEAMAKKRG